MLALLFAIALSWLGAVGPFLALELRDKGVDGWAFSLAMTSMPLARLFLGPLWGALTDRWQAERRVLLMAAATSALATVAVWVSPLMLAPVAVFAMASTRVGVMPLIDSHTTRLMGDGYGRVRAWGSVGFVIAVLTASSLREHLGVSTLAVGSVVAALLVPAVFILPAGAPPQKPHPILPAVRELLSDPPVRWLLVAAALHFMGHSGYHSYFSMHVESLGLGDHWTGIAIALGVGIEIVLLRYAEPLLERFGARRLLTAGIALAIPRWLITATAGPMVVIGVQAMHGATFALFWVGALSRMTRLAPERIRTSSVAVLGAAVGGVGSMVGTFGGGLLAEGPGTRWVFLAGTCTATLATLAALAGRK